MEQKIKYSCQNPNCNAKWSISLEEFKNKNSKKIICEKCNTKIDFILTNKLFMLKNLRF